MRFDRRQPNRPAPTLLQRVNPIWWAGDVERPLPVYGPDKKLISGWPWWQWFKRNPFCNFTMVIIGIAHKSRDCHYSRSPWTYADTGWNYGWSMPGIIGLPRPFVSHRGSWLEWAIGWKTSGGFTMQCRRANSPNAKGTP